MSNDVWGVVKKVAPFSPNRGFVWFPWEASAQSTLTLFFWDQREPVPLRFHLREALKTVLTEAVFGVD